MNINELLVDPAKPDQRPSDNEKHDKKNKVRLSDFLQYPTLDDPEPDSENDNIVLRDLKIPEMNPKAAELVARLVEATGTLEVLEVLHDGYQMYCDSEFVIDIEADEWPHFWDEILS